MTVNVRIASNASMVSTQLLRRRVRETWLQEVWAGTGRVQLAIAFFASLVAWKWRSMGEPEAFATRGWFHRAGQNTTGQ